VGDFKEEGEMTAGTVLPCRLNHFLNPQDFGANHLYIGFFCSDRVYSMKRGGERYGYQKK
jgi:hypothetical protein